MRASMVASTVFDGSFDEDCVHANGADRSAQVTKQRDRIRIWHASAGAFMVATASRPDAADRGCRGNVPNFALLEGPANANGAAVPIPHWILWRETGAIGDVRVPLVGGLQRQAPA
jgi:hypothetical protein